jgi:hypothetical protein
VSLSPLRIWAQLFWANPYFVYRFCRLRRARARALKASKRIHSNTDWVDTALHVAGIFGAIGLALCCIACPPVIIPVSAICMARAILES